MLGTDGSTPMAIDYFEAMGAERVAFPERISFALDHYAPPASRKTAALHDRVRDFARRYGIEWTEVGDGISHQLLAESGRALPGRLVIGADSHTVTAGAFNAFATGIGSSDLAAAMISGHIWLKVPESIKVVLTGARPSGLDAKDIALALLGKLGSSGASYQALEFQGPAVAGLDMLDMDDRQVLSNLSVETGAKAGIFPADPITSSYLEGRTEEAWASVDSDPDASYIREHVLDISRLSPQIALPHEPVNAVPVTEAIGTKVQMVFLGTCIGGRVADFHRALETLESGGGIADGVHFVATPASKSAYLELIEDGTIAKLVEHGRDGHDARLRRLLRHLGSHPRRWDEHPLHRQPQFQGPHGKRNDLDLSRFSRNMRGLSGYRLHLRSTRNRVLTRMEIRLEGRARRLGDDINTDYIISSTRKRDSLDPEVLKHYLLETLDPDFARSVRPDDLIVAGTNFGCGSAMEVAVTVVVGAGIKGVLAGSFSRTYYRNAINNGLIPIECDTSEMEEGDRVVVILTEGNVTVRNETKAKDLPGQPFPKIILDILAAGGIVPYFQRHKDFREG